MEMHCINKLLIGAFLLGLVVLQAGCHTMDRMEYQVWLYNFSGAKIAVVISGDRNVVDDKKYALLYDKQREESILFPEILAIDFAGIMSCYSLEIVKVGGYAQFDQSSNLLARLKLEEDKKIYVYNISKNGFQPDNDAGVQPEGYPASPTSC